MKRLLPPILLLVAALLLSRWVVGNLRTAGSMTVLESQSMQMNMKPPPGAAPVSLETVSPEFFQPGLTVTGSVQAWESEEVVARIVGRVLKMHVYPGDPVQPGQLLVELDSQEVRQRTLAAQAGTAEAGFRLEAAHQHHARGQMELDVMRQEIRANQLAIEQAEAECASARSETAYGEAEWKRAEQLYQVGGISQEEWQKSQTDLTGLRSQQKIKELEVARAQANLSKASKSLEMQRAEADVFLHDARALSANRDKNQAEAGVAATIESYTRLTALNRGTVVERLVSPGTLVQPGTVLLRLRSSDRLRLQARVPQDYSALVVRGARVTVEIPGGEPLTTRISSDFLETQESTRTFTVEAQLDNRHGSTGLRVGSFVQMQIALAKRKRRLTVPVSALQHDLDGKAFVWVALGSNAHPDKKPFYTCIMHPEVQSDKPGQCPKCKMELQLADPPGSLRAVKRPVESGGNQAGRISILSGLGAGDQVVVAGFQGLRDGSPVIGVPWSEQGPVELPPPAKKGKFDPMGMPMPDDYCSPAPVVRP